MILQAAKLKKQLKAFATDESGQSTTEYVLLLLFVVIAVRSAGSQLKTKLSEIMNSVMNNAQTAADEAAQDM